MNKIKTNYNNKLLIINKKLIIIIKKFQNYNHKLNQHKLFYNKFLNYKYNKIYH